MVTWQAIDSMHMWLQTLKRWSRTHTPRLNFCDCHHYALLGKGVIYVISRDDVWGVPLHCLVNI
jgi:hypothetical protein